MLQHYSKKKKKNLIITAWKVSKYGVFYGPYFPVFGLVDLYERIIQILGKVGGVQYNWLKFYFYHINKISSIQNEYLKIILVLSILWNKSFHYFLSLLLIKQLIPISVNIAKYLRLKFLQNFLQKVPF